MNPPSLLHIVLNRTDEEKQRTSVLRKCFFIGKKKAYQILQILYEHQVGKTFMHLKMIDRHVDGHTQKK